MSIGPSLATGYSSDPDGCLCVVCAERQVSAGYAGYIFCDRCNLIIGCGDSSWDFARVARMARRFERRRWLQRQAAEGQRPVDRVLSG